MLALLVCFDCVCWWMLRVWFGFCGLVVYFDLVSCTGLLVWGLVVLFGLRVCLGLVVLDLRRILLILVATLGDCGFTLIRVLGC